MGHVDASVVIISRDGSDRVLTLLRSLEDQVVEGATFEVVVVDDGSAVPIEPDIVDAGLSTSLRLQVVRCDGDGNRSAARNAGAHVASGEVLIFGDGDQEAPSHWISEHLRWHRRADGLLLVGHRREYGGQGNDAWAPEVRDRVTSEFSHNYRRVAARWYLAFGGNISVKRSVFVNLGGFDTGFAGWGFEDVEFGLRAERAGLEVALNPHAWTWDGTHRVRRDSARVKEWEQNRAYFHRKHDDPEARAIGLIEHYSRLTSVPASQAWMASFRTFDDRVRAVRALSPLSPVRETVTVLDDADVEYVRSIVHRVGEHPSGGCKVDLGLRPCAGPP